MRARILVLIGLVAVLAAPLQAAQPLAPAINNGNGGTFNLIAGETYLGGVTINANTTINGNGAILEKGTNENIDVAAGATLVMSNASVRLASSNTQAGSFGIRVLNDGSAQLSRVSIRDQAIALFFPGISPSSSFSQCTFTNHSQNTVLIQLGASPSFTQCTFNINAGIFGVQASNASPRFSDCDFIDASAGVGAPPAAIAYLGVAFSSGGSSSIASNDFVNCSPAIKLEATIGTATAPHIAGNTFSFPNRPSGLAIQTTNAEPRITGNIFLGGASAIELTGADSFAQPPFTPEAQAISGNYCQDQRGGLVFNLNHSIPDIVDNTLINTDTAIYLKQSGRCVRIERNTLQSLGLDEGNINVEQPIGPAITVGEQSTARVANNYVNGFVGGIQVIQNSNATLVSNHVLRCYFGGILIESGAVAWLVDNTSERNRSDDYFVDNATAYFIGNRSFDCGQFPGNLAGASSYGFLNNAQIPVFIGNLASGSKDVSVGVTASARIVRFHGNTIRRTGLAGLFIEAGGVVESARGNFFQNQNDLLSVTGVGNATGRMYANTFIDGGFAFNVNATNCTGVFLAHSIFDNMVQPPAAITNNAIVPFEWNVFGDNVAADPYPAINTEDNGRVTMKHNRLAALSGIGHAGNNTPGFFSSSDQDWWGAPNGPNPPGNGLQAVGVTVTNPTASPECFLTNSGLLNIGAGETVTRVADSGGPGGAGGDFIITLTSPRAIGTDYLVASRVANVSTLLVAPPNAVYPFGLFTYGVTVTAWRNGTGTAQIRLDPAFVPPGFTAADAILTRLDLVNSLWLGVPSRVEQVTVDGGGIQDWLVFQWGGPDTPDPNGLFAIQFPTDKATVRSSWRASETILGRQTLSSQEFTACAFSDQGGDIPGRLSVADLVALVNQGR